MPQHGAISKQGQRKREEEKEQAGGSTPQHGATSMQSKQRKEEERRNMKRLQNELSFFILADGKIGKDQRCQPRIFIGPRSDHSLPMSVTH